MFRAVRLAAALLLACLGLVVTSTRPASADALASRAASSSRSARPTSVFVGTIDRVDARATTSPTTITASRAYQGTPERSTQVVSAGGRDACGLGELGVGTTYVFLATGTEAPYEADTCGGTSVANPTKVDKVEEHPRRGDLGRAAPSAEGPLTLVEESAPAGFARAGRTRRRGRADRPPRPRRRTTPRPLG